MKSDTPDINSIRDLIGEFIGKTIMDITQCEEQEVMDGEDPYIMLMFDDGSTLKLNIVGLESYDAVTDTGISMHLEDYCDCDECNQDDEDDLEIN